MHKPIDEPTAQVAQVLLATATVLKRIGTTIAATGQITKTDRNLAYEASNWALAALPKETR